LKGIVVGTSGIGKFVAQKLSDNGLLVSDIAGNDSDNLIKNIDSVGELTGMTPQGHLIGHKFNKLEGIINENRLDFAAICVPDHLHYRMTMAALRTDAHVMVEKPLVWFNALIPQENYEMARIMLDTGGERLTVNSQLVALVNPIWERYDLFNDEIYSFTYSQLTNGENRGRAILVDLLPHALSMLIEAVPHASIEDLNYHIDETHRQAVEFSYGDVSVSIELREEPEKDKYLDVAYNGIATGIRPKFRQGVFGYDLQDYRGKQFDFLDPMGESIKQFASKLREEGDYLVSAKDALKNMELMSKIMQGVR